MPGAMIVPVASGVEPAVGIAEVIVRLVAFTVGEDQMRRAGSGQTDPVPVLVERLHRHTGPVAARPARLGVPDMDADDRAPAGAALEVEDQIGHREDSVSL